MPRKRLLTEIISSEKKGRQIHLQLVNSLSDAATTKVIRALKEQTQPDLPVSLSGKILIADALSPATEDYLLSFGGNNYLLAKVRAGTGYKYLSFNQKRRIKKGSSRVYFVYPEAINFSYRRYFSKSFRPKVGIESVAQGIARLSQIEDAAKRSFDCEGRLVYDARYQATAAAARKLGLTDLARYLSKQHYKELLKAANRAIELGWEKTLEAIAKELITGGVENTEIRDNGGATVHLQTWLNPYREIIGLERELGDKLGKPVLLDLHEKR